MFFQSGPPMALCLNSPRCRLHVARYLYTACGVDIHYRNTVLDRGSGVRQKTREAALQLACRRRCVSADDLSFLLDRCPITATDVLSSHGLALRRLCRHCNVQALRVLLSRFELNVAAHDACRRACRVGCRHGHLDVLQEFCVNTKDVPPAFVQSIMRVASENCHAHIVQFLCSTFQVFK